MKPLASVYRGFKQADSGPFLVEMLRRYPSPTEAAQAIDYVRQLARSCATFSRVSQEGVEITYRLSPLSLAPLGDESVGVMLIASGVPQVGTVQVAYVFWRRANTVAQLDYTVTGDAAAGGEDVEVAAIRADEVLSRPGTTP